MLSDEFHALDQRLAEAGRIVADYYRGLEERPVGSPAPLDEVLEHLDGTLTERGVGTEQALREFEEHLLEHTMAVPHPLYLGLLNSSPLPGAIAAESLVGALNNNSGSWEQGPAFVAAETEVVRCFREILGLGPNFEGLLLPGGSYTALHGLQLAREFAAPDWRRSGIRSLPGNPRVYVSEASHFSVARAARTLGVADADVVSIEGRGRGQMNAGRLDEQLQSDLAEGALPIAVVVTLGTTGTGAIDPLEDILDVCEKHGVWVHVDACYGGAGALLEELSPHFRGLERADSVAVDPHKWFFIPMVAGLILTKHRALEQRAFDVNAAYIPTGNRLDPFRRGHPTSRRGAALPIWMALRAHGLHTLRLGVRANCSNARFLERRLGEAGFEVLPGGEMSIACARWSPPGLSNRELDALQERIAERVVASGKAWFGTTLLNGRRWLRMALLSLHTREEHLEGLVELLARCARAAETPAVT